MPNYALDEYRRITAPGYAQSEIGRRYQLAQPQLQQMLASLRAGLNQRGMYSEAPVTRATYRAGSDVMRGVTSDVYQNLDERKMALIQVLTQLQEMEKARKSQRSSSLWGGIGSLLGMVGGQGLGYLFTKNLLNKMYPQTGGE